MSINNFLQNPINTVLVSSNTVVNQILVKTAEQIPMNVKYTNSRISFDGKYWFITVGIDVGVKDLAICSNGMTFKNINKTRIVKKLEKRLRRLQRRVSGKYLKNKEGSKFVKTSNIIKIEKQIKLLHRTLANNKK